MHKHFNRKNKCKESIEISYDDAKFLTINKKYIFLFNPVILTNDDYIFIIKNYNKKKKLY